jgi:putative acetyltransferase
VTPRRFEAQDLEPLQRLVHLTIDSSYAGLYPPRAVAYFRELYSLQQILDRQAAGEIVVVECDGALVATGAIVAAEISGVFVHPQLQRRGIGAQVMDVLERHAQAAGHESVHLAVSLPSRRFYESRGYRMLEPCSIDVGEGERLDYWKAEKSLGAGES